MGPKHATITVHYNQFFHMLLNPKHRKALNIIWGALAILIAGSMILAYLPSLYR